MCRHYRFVIAMPLVLGFMVGALRADDDLPPSPGVYMGRTIARTMHYAGAPWLVRESREREEECSTLLKNLGLKAGDTV